MPNPKMTPERRAEFLKWINELESEKYSQGKSFLKSSTGEYCCLGVGVISCVQEEPTLQRNLQEYSIVREKFQIDNNGELTQAGARLLKELFPNKFYNKLDYSIDALTIMNDHWNFTFKEIATFLRAVIDHNEECFVYVN
jgi:hypothetical protein